MSPRMPNYDTARERKARAQESVVTAPEPCPECKTAGDHTWWCRIAPAILPDGTRPYYWRD